MKLSTTPYVIAFVFCCAAVADNYAQEVLNREVSLQLQEVTLRDALTALENVAHVKFSFSRNKLNLHLEEKVSVNALNQKLGDILRTLFHSEKIEFVTGDDLEFIILRPRNDDTTKKDDDG